MMVWGNGGKNKSEPVCFVLSDGENKYPDGCYKQYQREKYIYYYKNKINIHTQNSSGNRQRHCHILLSGEFMCAGEGVRFGYSYRLFFCFLRCRVVQCRNGECQQHFVGMQSWVSMLQVIGFKRTNRL